MNEALDLSFRDRAREWGVRGDVELEGYFNHNLVYYTNVCRGECFNLKSSHIRLSIQHKHIALGFFKNVI